MTQSNIDEVIQKAKTAIEHGDIEDAVRYDGILNQYLSKGLEATQKQAEFHKNQYDFIFKYRLKYYFVEFSLLLLTILMIRITMQADTVWNIVLYGGPAVYLFYKTFKNFYRHQVGMNITANEERAIVSEKSYHSQLLHDLSKITNYQVETFAEMTELYKQYEEQTNDNFSNLFKGLDKHPKNTSGDNSEEHD